MASKDGGDKNEAGGSEGQGTPEGGVPRAPTLSADAVADRKKVLKAHLDTLDKGEQFISDKMEEHIKMVEEVYPRLEFLKGVVGYLAVVGDPAMVHENSTKLKSVISGWKRLAQRPIRARDEAMECLHRARAHLLNELGKLSLEDEEEAPEEHPSKENEEDEGEGEPQK